MAKKTHQYRCKLTWQGNLGSGTADYRAYRRDFIVEAGSKPAIDGSSDPSFMGDTQRWNPEDLLVASVASCHKLWYLHLCADAGIVVSAYEDEAVGEMVEDGMNGGQFTNITLNPRVTISRGSDKTKAQQLHKKAHELCFIANSLNFPIECQAEIFAE